MTLIGMDPLYGLVQRRLRLGGILCLCLAVILLIIAGLVLRNHRQFLATAKHAQGEITGFTTRLDNGSTYYKPTIQFHDEHGDAHVFESSTSSTHKSGEIGDAVDVLYAPEAPADAMLNSFASIWLMPLILVGIAVTNFLVGTALIIWPRIQAAGERTFQTVADARQ